MDSLQRTTSPSHSLHTSPALLSNPHALSAPTQPHTNPHNHHVRQGRHVRHRALHRSCGRHARPAGLRELQHRPHQLLPVGRVRRQHGRVDAPGPPRRRPRRRDRPDRHPVLAHQCRRRCLGLRLLCHPRLLPEQQRRRPRQHRLRPRHPLSGFWPLPNYEGSPLAHLCVSDVPGELGRYALHFRMEEGDL